MKDTTVTFKEIFDVAKPLIKSALYYTARMPLVKQILRHWQGPCAIFCLHRVLPDEQIFSDLSPNRNLAITESRFNEMLNFLSKRYRIISLDELINHLESCSKELVVCLTFDDGYRDNLKYALPILEQFNCPATVYINTRFPEGDTWMWWYEIWDYLQSKERLDVEFEGIEGKWNCYNLSQRIRCYFDLSAWMMLLSLERQKTLLTSITGSERRRSYSEICLDWDDIKKLDKHPLMTIGAHTHSHPVLSMENEATAHEEILSSKLILERQLMHSVDHFAYPFGTSKDAGVREYRLAKESGFLTATTANCFKTDFTHKFQLPRYGISERTTPKNVENRIGGLSNFLGLQLG